MSFAATHPALPLSKHQHYPHVVVVEASPNPAPIIPTWSVIPSLRPTRLALFTMFLWERVAPLGLPVVPWKTQGIYAISPPFLRMSSREIPQTLGWSCTFFSYQTWKTVFTSLTAPASQKIAQFQLNRIHLALSHLHQPLTNGWT